MSIIWNLQVLEEKLRRIHFGPKLKVMAHVLQCALYKVPVYDKLPCLASQKKQNDMHPCLASQLGCSDMKWMGLVQRAPPIQFLFERHKSAKLLAAAFTNDFAQNDFTF